MPDTTTNDIDALLRFLDEGGWDWHHAALTALVAERDALRERVAELEAQPPADRDLRERLVCAALTAMVMAEASYVDAAEGAVCYADAAIAAMRKGESDAK